MVPIPIQNLLASPFDASSSYIRTRIIQCNNSRVQLLLSISLPYTCRLIFLHKILNNIYMSARKMVSVSDDIRKSIFPHVANPIILVRH